MTDQSTDNRDRLIRRDPTDGRDGLTEKVLAEGDESETSVTRTGGAGDFARKTGSLRFAGRWDVAA